ncbi:MAG: acetate kinase [Micrococcales bacterium]|nr:acetate kinase [Micrococcales bacterium]
MSPAHPGRVLVINAGSSSLKYQLIELVDERTVASGLVERIGESHTASVSTVAELSGPGSESRVWRASTGGDSEPAPESDRDNGVKDHTAAFGVMLDQLRAKGIDPADGLMAIGHRVVHGGERFVEPTIITDEVKQQIDELSRLAPLHNPPNLSGIVAAEVTFAGVPQVAVFDTAFHSTLPPVARSYAIDVDVAERYGIRRFGFHGISFQHVAGAAAEFLGRPRGELKLIIIHLGNGASACAVDGGRSVETSMGLTPLEGLMMGTRGGDIDPGVLIHLQREGGSGVDELDRLLNHGSGLLGLGGFGDIRDVRKAADSGDARAALAIEVYTHRIRGYVGAYLAQLGRVDAVVFTAGVGENNASVRARALAGLDALGIRVDEKRNGSSSRKARVISPADSAVTVMVVPTNEELEIARQAAALVRG